MTITNVVVKRRPAVSCSGFNTQVEVKEPVSRVPTLEELVFDIYDEQRTIISGVYPKRWNCHVPTPINGIEKLYRMNPKMMAFDGMSHQEATDYFMHAALGTGIRNEFCIPFMFAKKITMRSHAFQQGYSYVFEMIDGLRYMTQSTQQEFNWLTMNRQILSNLSYKLNKKYNCNLHIAYDEAERVYVNTGEIIPHMRNLFTRACDFYTNPNLVPLEQFIRFQVKELRKYSIEEIHVLITQDDDKIMAIDPNLAFEIQQAKCIYTGRIKQWVGDFSNEPIFGA